MLQSSFEVSSIEMERSGPSYTIDTIKALKTIYGEDTDFYFIIGADCIMITYMHKLMNCLQVANSLLQNDQDYTLDFNYHSTTF